MVRLSVIIPVYNGEAYLDFCLSSILKNNIYETEILFVNDGSTDNTKRIIEEYEKKYSFIKAYSISHRGLSETRNFGIKQADGEYISFIDVDDTISHDYIDTILKNLGNDLLVFGYELDFVDEKYTIKCEGDNDFFDKKEFNLAVKIMFEKDLFNFAWNKVYRKELISNIKFSDKYYQGEDLAFNCEVVKTVSHIKLIKSCLYKYKKRNVETMVTKFVENYELILQNKKKILESLFNDVDRDKIYQNVLNNYMIKEYEVFTINLFKTKNYKFNERNELITKYVLANNKQIKKAEAFSFYTKIFKSLCLFNSPFLLNVLYLFLTFIKNNLGKSYLAIRKKIYLNDIK